MIVMGACVLLPVAMFILVVLCAYRFISVFNYFSFFFYPVYYSNYYVSYLSTMYVCVLLSV